MFDLIGIKTWIIGLIAITVLVSIFVGFTQDPLEASDEVFELLPDISLLGDMISFEVLFDSSSKRFTAVFHPDVELNANEIRIRTIYDTKDHSKENDPDCSEDLIEFDDDYVTSFNEKKELPYEIGGMNIINCCRKEEEEKVEFILEVGRQGEPTIYKSDTYSCREP